MKVVEPQSHNSPDRMHAADKWFEDREGVGAIEQAYSCWVLHVHHDTF